METTKGLYLMGHNGSVSFKPETPMMKQYFDAKSEFPGVLMAMRVGDFYEFYGEDAETAARLLEITLTGKEDGANGRVPMAGVPYHAFERYVARLVSLGQRVAMCEQVENPKTAKGLVRRQVQRVLSPGTVLEESMLAGSEASYVCALHPTDQGIGLATLDPSTGELLATWLADSHRLLEELTRLRPAEILLCEDKSWPELGATPTVQVPKQRPEQAEHFLRGHFGVAHLQGFGLQETPLLAIPVAMALAYAQRNGVDLRHVTTLSVYRCENFLAIDPFTRRSLELTQNLSDGSKRHTLFEVLDSTVTGMGARALRRWIDQPLLERAAIRARHEVLRRLNADPLVRDELRSQLRSVLDLERLASRCSARVASPRDLANLRGSLLALPALHRTLRKIATGLLQELAQRFQTHDSLAKLLQDALVEEPPLHLREGGLIRGGFDPELDRLQGLSREGREYIARLEASERAQTGIGTLKVGYNSVFGYYLEVGKQYQAKVPEHYIRKQTTANAERYITAELKEHESAVLSAAEKAAELESIMFDRLREQVAEQTIELLATARAIGELDALLSLAVVAETNGYVAPEFTDANGYVVTHSRHPVVERTCEHFVPNDLNLAPLGEGTRVVILTGPNMSGKSTYLRQLALIVIMAQMGSFVPAVEAKLGIHDQVFARIGAKDELALGQSTFMVEMTECAYILNQATADSLIVLDEVGRGTSTYDGMAIAWAIIEHLVQIGAKTLFATHYHQLNVLADQMEGVANFRVSVTEVGESIVWTHRVLEGGTDRSYGIHVARMAGVPPSVLTRSAEILADLQGTAHELPRPGVKRLQLSLFEAEEPEVVGRLRDLAVESLTPLQALQILDEWKRSLPQRNRS